MDAVPLATPRRSLPLVLLLVMSFAGCGSDSPTEPDDAFEPPATDYSALEGRWRFRGSETVQMRTCDDPNCRIFAEIEGSFVEVEAEVFITVGRVLLSNFRRHQVVRGYEGFDVLDRFDATPDGPLGWTVARRCWLTVEQELAGCDNWAPVVHLSGLTVRTRYEPEEEEPVAIEVWIGSTDGGPLEILGPDLLANGDTEIDADARGWVLRRVDDGG